MIIEQTVEIPADNRWIRSASCWTPMSSSTRSTTILTYWIINALAILPVPRD